MIDGATSRQAEGIALVGFYAARQACGWDKSLLAIDRFWEKMNHCYISTDEPIRLQGIAQTHGQAHSPD